MKKKALKKILKTKSGNLIFQTIVVLPLLAFCLIGAAMVWLGQER